MFEPVRRDGADPAWTEPPDDAGPPPNNSPNNTGEAGGLADRLRALMKAHPPEAEPAEGDPVEAEPVEAEPVERLVGGGPGPVPAVTMRGPKPRAAPETPAPAESAQSSGSDPDGPLPGGLLDPAAMGLARQGESPLDIPAVLATVREVPGVRGAELHRDEDGSRRLRLELADNVDVRDVERQVARLLKERLGVTAEPNQRDGRPPHAAVSPVVTTATAKPPPPAQAVQAVRATPAPERTNLRVILERVQVVTAGLEAAVEVGLAIGGIRAVGRAAGPAVEAHVLRAAASAATDAVDVLLAGRGRCAVEYVDVMAAGTVKVALVVLLMLTPTGAERLSGSAPVAGDARQAVVRAALAALNRRLAALLP